MWLSTSEFWLLMTKFERADVLAKLAYIAAMTPLYCSEDESLIVWLWNVVKNHEYISVSTRFNIQSFWTVNSFGFGLLVTDYLDLEAWVLLLCQLMDCPSTSFFFQVMKAMTTILHQLALHHFHFVGFYWLQYALFPSYLSFVGGFDLPWRQDQAEQVPRIS